MTDMQDPLERAYHAMPDAAVAMGKAEQAYEQTAAEEAWEYSYQVKHADGWETACNDVTHVDEWWPDKHVAAWAAHAAYDPYIDRPIRLVRRRVSPPEVVE